MCWINGSYNNWTTAHPHHVCVCVCRGIILKNPANGETMICEVKPLQEKSDQAKQRHIQNMTVWKIMINKNTHMCVLEVLWIMLMFMAESVTMIMSAWWRAKKADLLCSCSAFFYMSLHTSLNSAMTTSILCLHVTHHIKVATELRQLRTFGLLWITNAYAIANRNNQGSYSAMHEGCHNNSSINRQNHNSQNHDRHTHKWYGGRRRWLLDMESNWKYSSFTDDYRQLKRCGHTAWEQNQMLTTSHHKKAECYNLTQGRELQQTDRSCALI